MDLSGCKLIAATAPSSGNCDHFSVLILSHVIDKGRHVVTRDENNTPLASPGEKKSTVDLSFLDQSYDLSVGSIYRFFAGKIWNRADVETLTSEVWIRATVAILAGKVVDQ